MFKFSVLNAANQVIIDRVQKDNHRNNAVFHPSEWDGCHRKIAYQYYEAVKAITIDQSVVKVDPRGQRIFANGHYMHDRWRNDLLFVSGCKLYGKWMCRNFMEHPEPKIYGVDNSLGITRPEICECGCNRFEYIEIGYYNEETNWGGHVDVVLELESPPSSDFKFIVVDFKTMNPFEFKSLKEPKPAHKTQMQIYLFLSGLKIGKLLYEDKGGQDVKEFDVYRDDDFIAIKREEAILLKYQVNNKNSKGQFVLPPKAFMSRGHKECLRCRYRGHCWK